MSPILFIIFVHFGCIQTDSIETGLELSPEPSDPLEGSAETLDRIIAKTEKMNADLEIIIKNEEAIFKAVTNCSSDETCETLKNEMNGLSTGSKAP
jgi:hypothetical protein